MDFTKYSVTLKGETPLLMHSDNLMFDEQIKQWMVEPANKKLSIKGDDRSPAWRWIGYLYIENGKIVIPSDNLMTLMREGGAACPTGNRRGQGKQNFKSQSQSGIIVDQNSWVLKVNGNEIQSKSFEDLIGNNDFAYHEKIAKKNGFELMIKRAKIGSNKHVRVRPRFDKWQCSGTITVLDEQITIDILRNILFYAGIYSGLCDWRPSSPKSPGPWGKFGIEVNEIK